MRIERFTIIALLIIISSLMPSLRATGQTVQEQGRAAHAAQSYLLVISKHSLGRKVIKVIDKRASVSDGGRWLCASIYGKST